MNALDRLIGYVAPQKALKRAYYRAHLDAAASYDGASRGRRTAGWRAPSTSANTETQGALPLLRNRARDLVRNNPYATAAVREIPAHTVGNGIIPQARASEAQQDRMDRLVRRWFGTRACDADGRNSFYGIQNLVMRTVIESGECLVRRRVRRTSDGLPVPMQLQVLEPDHLDTLRDGVRLNSGNLIVQGIEFNRIGQRVAYWLYPQHPGEYFATRKGFDSKRVPADEIIHVYRQDRPGQVRGVPWLAPVLMKLRDFADYEDAQLMRQKVAACYAAFVHDGNGDDLGPQGQVQADDQTELPEKIEPGTIERLPSGKQVTFGQPPPAEGFEEYSLVTLHSIATGLGIPYMVLTGDLRQVNFSSGRMGWLSFQRDIEQWRHQMLIPQLCEGVWQWFADLVQLQNGIEDLGVKWTAPRRELVDPGKEIPAIRDAIRSGLMTQEQAVREFGHDPAEFFQEYAQSNERLDELDITLDSDPRNVSQAGVEQPPEPSQTEE